MPPVRDVLFKDNVIKSGSLSPARSGNRNFRSRSAFVKDHDDLKKRLSELDKEINRQRSSAIGYAFRLATELVVGVCFGGFIGWWLDRWFGTTPIFLLVFFVLGLAAGIMNVIRTAHKMQAELSDGSDNHMLKDKQADRDQNDD